MTPEEPRKRELQVETSARQMKSEPVQDHSTDTNHVEVHLSKYDMMDLNVKLWVLVWVSLKGVEVT